MKTVSRSALKWLVVPAGTGLAWAAMATAQPEVKPGSRPAPAVAPAAAKAVAAKPVTTKQNAQPAGPQPEDVLKNAAGAKVEIAFVVDTTGSMGDLIEGAKRKIWSIVSTISTAKPAPQVRIGFVAYRDKGDEYETQVHDLSDDLDRSFSILNTFAAAGGGDTPEHVHRGLSDAVSRMKWSDARQTGGSLYQVIFLVGDAPPHDDYTDGFDGRKSIREALARGITLNAIQCGGIAGTAPVWQEFARLGEGKYFAIAQSGGMTAIETPFDVEIAKLADEVEGTTVARGGKVEQFGARIDALEARVSSSRANAALAPSAKADRAAFNANSAQVYGAWDLTTQLQRGEVKAADVAKMKDEELPEELRKLSAPQRVAYLEEKLRQRTAAQKKLAELQKKREEFIQAALKKSGQSDKNSFDAAVGGAMRSQAAARGIHFK
jgi:hypothetical protein